MKNTIISSDLFVVTLADMVDPVQEINHYIKSTEVITINELIKIKEEARIAKPLYSSFVEKYESKMNKKYKNFNLIEKDQVKKEFYTMYSKIKKIKI